MHVFLYLYLSVFEEICLLSCSTEFFFFSLSLLLSVSYGKSHLEFCSPNKVLHVNSVVSTWNKWFMNSGLVARPIASPCLLFSPRRLANGVTQRKRKRKKDNKHSDKFALISSYFALELMREKKCKKGCLVSIYWMSTKGRWSSFQLFYRLESVFLLIAVLNRDFSLGGWWESHRMCTCL